MSIQSVMLQWIFVKLKIILGSLPGILVLSSLVPAAAIANGSVCSEWPSNQQYRQWDFRLRTGEQFRAIEVEKHYIPSGTTWCLFSGQKQFEVRENEITARTATREQKMPVYPVKTINHFPWFRLAFVDLKTEYGAVVSSLKDKLIGGQGILTGVWFDFPRFIKELNTLYLEIEGGFNIYSLKPETDAQLFTEFKIMNYLHYRFYHFRRYSLFLTGGAGFLAERLEKDSGTLTNQTSTYKAGFSSRYSATARIQLAFSIHWRYDADQSVRDFRLVVAGGIGYVF